MDFDEKGNEEQSFGFEQHPLGWYAFQVLEGIDLKTREDNDGKSLMIPFQSIKALKKPKDLKNSKDGDEDAVSGKYTHFIVIIKKDGDKSKAADQFILSLLTITDLIKKFRSKFPDGIEPDDKKFIEQLKISLPGKVIAGEIEHRKNQNGDPQAQFKLWKRYGKKKAAEPEKPPKKEEPDDDFEDEDFD